MPVICDATNGTTSTLWAGERGWLVARQKRTVDEAQDMLDRGEWLTPGEAALLLPVNRATVNRYLLKGETKSGLPLRHRMTTSRRRLCHPDDLRAIIAAGQEVHEGTEAVDAVPPQR